MLSAVLSKALLVLNVFFTICEVVAKLVMKIELQRAKSAFAKSKQGTTGLVIFLTCLFIYLFNDRIDLGSNDNIPHTLLAFNWLENHTLHFDNFRDGYLYSGGDRPYFLLKPLMDT